MILDNKQTLFSYRCPECGNFVSSIVGIFSLTADMIRLKCPCGGSHAQIERLKDNKLRITVPCFICSTDHSFTVSSNLFFNKELFSYPCTFYGVDICLIGNEDKVKEAQEKANKELSEILQENDVESLRDIKNNNTEEFIDPEAGEILLYSLYDMVDEGKIKCDCENNKDSLSFLLEGENLKISCSRCERKKYLPITSLTYAYDFLNKDELILE